MSELCSWDEPGANRYTGTVAAAVARYELPGDAEREILWKWKGIRPDAVVYIGRDSIKVAGGKATMIYDMHFGKGKLCKGPVVMPKWPDSHEEPALMYCSGPHCIVVPIVCNNVSRIDYTPVIKDPPFRFWEGDPSPPMVYTPPEKVNTVPEPASILLAGMGVAMALAMSRRRKP